MTNYLDSATVRLKLTPSGVDVSTPPNDNFANAIALSTTLPGSLTPKRTTRDATKEASEVEIGKNDQSVWYTFTPTTTAYYRFLFSNIFPNGDDHTFYIGVFQVYMRHSTTLADFVYFYDGRANVVGVGGNSISGNGGLFAMGNIEIIAHLQAGETYTIKAWSDEKFSTPVFNGQTVRFDLDWDVYTVTPPANDDFANAEVVGATLPDTFSGTTVDATFEEGDFDPATQTVWYKFTPSVTSSYRFKALAASLVGHPSSGSSAWANLRVFDGTGVTTVADIDLNTDQIGSNLFLDASATEDTSILVSLVAGTDYYIQVSSDLDLDNGAFNHRVLDFDIELTAVPPPANDNFANRASISGASGSQEFDTLAADNEATEPLSYYWNVDNTGQRSVWFEWVCPATGDYVFKVESTVDYAFFANGPNYDLAIWQGSALASLTKIVRNWAGSQNVEGRVRAPATSVGFHATSGQTYIIQISNWDADVTATKLTWRTNTVTGDSTTSPATFPDGRVDNFGNDDSEPPPNFATILGSHPSWWFTTGQVGHVKWFKKVYTSAQTVTISGKQYDVLDPNLVGSSVDGGLIAYKGANYGSLTVADISGGSNPAAMMISSGKLVTAASADTMNIDVSPGDTLWVCLFGFYDADYAGSDSLDASEWDVDLHIPGLAPDNDSPESTPFTHDFYFDRSEFGSYWVYPEAAERAGSTANGTADPSEPALAGVPATRTVWYHFGIDGPGTYRIWVESAVDCVLGLYGEPNTWTGVGDLTLITSDDDSGAGDQPEIIQAFGPLTSPFFGDYWLAVDSKAEGTFVLKYQRLSDGTPPANDDFANAEVITSFPFVSSGTTVAATAETAEREAEQMGTGPKDTVWYKYVATADGSLKIKATCDTFNDDAYVYVDTWKGTSLDTLIRNPEPPPSGPGGGIFRGFYNHFDTPLEIDQAAITMDVVNGQTYYIRVQTESGGSEDFTLYVDSAAVYLDLTAGGTEAGPFGDVGTAYVELTASGSDEFHGTIIDSGTVYLTITPGATWETLGHETTDAATVRLTLSVLGGECFSRFHFTGEGEADTRWAVDDALVRWASDVETRWLANVEIQPGCH